jgi:copper(I)-binding protein
LTGVSSEVAEAVDMHESKMEGDVMQMHPVETVPLQAGAKTTFKPGGLHIMLIGVKKDLKIGEEIEIILHFKNSDDINISVLVREPPALDDD